VIKVFDVIVELSKWIWSTEGRPRFASKSEVRRWFEKKSVIVNGESVSMDSEVASIESLVLFPKGNRKITFV